MDNKEQEKLGDKLQRGINLAYRRLIEQKQREDGELIYSIKGKIVHIRARDIKLEPQSKE
ncbi:hypothetical protein [Bacteroides sp. 519]|uniref:hypothetical protein n=1 Tax=Bacteroides sp. 519 TaxID=2302937 RepID=UPI0013D1B7A8|nr:hypothetical protein [Bacteroides sp. 519]NDV57498.1 hypothetical protein [Bacteroides sp. 519]